MPVSKSLPSKVDVAIVGSGYTGLNTARVLAKNGASVAVLDRETIGWGASSRNGGMATPGIKQSTAAIFRRYGPEMGRQFWDASIESIELLDEIIRDEKLECDWKREGHIGLAYKEKHFKNIRKSAAWLKKEVGYKAQVLSASDLRSEIGSNKFFGGLAYERSGGLQPAKYVFALAKAVANSGAKLLEKTDVINIEKANGSFQLETNRGELLAKEVVLATGGYTDMLVPKLKPKVFPVGSYIIVTEPLSKEMQAAISPKGRMFYDSKWFLNYFRLTPDGRMLWGGRNNLSTSLNLSESAQILGKQLVDTFPILENVKITHSWTGKLGVTFDLMPHIGQVDGLHYALGYSGHGLALATYLGTELGLILAGKKTSSPFSEIDHQTMIFYRNQPWFIPLAAQYYRLLDWIS
jgi:glycine/D-amino acid oxidase-like deaminating enzyme